MIRFIDLTADYWVDDDPDNDRMCAFLSTRTDTFVANASGGHVFSEWDDFDGVPDRERLMGLVPDGFFDDSEKPIPSHRAETIFASGEAPPRVRDPRIILFGKAEK